MTAAFIIVDPYSKFLFIEISKKVQLDDSYYSQPTI